MPQPVRDIDSVGAEDAVTPWMRVSGARWLVAACALILFLGALGRDVRRPLWHDEIFTLYVATRTGGEGLWNALSTGVDLNPPLYYVAVRGVAALLGPGAVATRLPSTVGFVAAVLAIYLFMRRRVGPWHAIAAALSLPLSGALMYAWEGRAYGLVLGLSAIALVAWQARGAGEWPRAAPLVCAGALAAAVFSHYYAVLMVLPLAAGELTRSLVRRHVDWPMWISLALASAAPLVVLGPLLRGAREFADTFWSAPSLDKLTTFYRELLDPLALVLVAAAGCMTLAAAMRRTVDSAPPMAATEARTARYLPPEEVVAALTLAALPVVGYVLALFTAAFHGRYVLQAVLGVAILVGWGAATLVTTSRNTAILVAVLILCVSGRLAGGALGLVRDPLDPLAEHRPLISVPRGDSPLVISHALDFLPIAHYSSSGGPAVLYLTEPSNQGRGATTAHRAMRLLTRYAPLDVRDFDAFVASHPHFFLYGRSSWVVRTLRSRGATLQFLGQNDTATLYAVDLAR